MITVQLDENNYFTGSYAKIGAIPGGLKVTDLPTDLSNHKTTCWRYGTYETEVESQIFVIDETTNEPKIDENGDFVFETIMVNKTVSDWIFDEEKHQILLSQLMTAASEVSIEEKIKMLEEKNAELQGTMDKLLTEIIPSVLNVQAIQEGDK